MARYVLTDEMWEKLEAILHEKGCYRRENNRNIMEGILWKLRTGAPWRDLPEEFCPWTTAYNRFNRWAIKGLWDDFFLHYEAKLIRNGCSPMEATLGLINMQVELGVVKNVPWDALLGGSVPNYIYAPMRMEIRSILKSLGVKCTTQKWLKS